MCSLGGNALAADAERDVDPAVFAIALEFGRDDDKLTKAVLELRILRRERWIFDRRVEATEDVLKGVVVTFGVSGGEIGERTRFGREKRRVFQKNLVVGVAVSDPEFFGALLVPSDGGFGAVDLDVETVLL